MKVREQKDINSDKHNVFHTHWPYYWLDNLGAPDIKKWVIFFGSDFKNCSGVVNREEYVKRANLCLDYIRENCVGLELYYKPHPAETDEHAFLNLEQFEIIGKNKVAELFLWDNKNKIKYAFSVFSTSALAAYTMGINSYSFHEFFAPAFHEIQQSFDKDYFGEMPPSFSIADLNQKFQENEAVPREDKSLTQDFRSLLEQKSGKIWFIISETRMLLTIMALAKLIKHIDPERQLGLIISRHHRWDIVDLSDVEKHFNDIVVFPRIFYSLKPDRIITAIRVALSIRKFKIRAEDIIIGFGHCDFVENCFIAYHKQSYRISFLPQLFFDQYFKTNRLDYIETQDFNFTKASFVYNKILEPLLGLHRTLYLEWQDGRLLNILKFQEPMNKLYDRVYLIHDLLTFPKT